MRAWFALPLALAGCGPKATALPEEPIARAATCGIVAAAQARKASADVEAKLSLEAQGRILHPALLTGSEGGAFDRTRAAQVVNAMPALGDKVTEGKWEPLVAACAAAFPATAAAGPVELPRERFAAEAGCHDLADYFTTALRASEADYAERIRAYDAMERRLDERMGASLNARGLTGAPALAARAKATAGLIALGPPVAVLDRCVERFPDQP